MRCSEYLEAFKLHGTLQAITYLTLNKICLNTIKTQIKSYIIKAPKLLENALIIIDFSNIQTDLSNDFCIELINLLTNNKMQVIGFTGVDSNQQTTLEKCSNLKLIDRQKRKNSKIKSEKNYNIITHKYTGPIRSGQQIYNNQGDIIIFGGINPGAEVIAAGSIHVYGTLSGRCIAGYKNNKDAIIYCHKLDAEILNIAGITINNSYNNKPNIIQVNNKDLIIKTI